MANDIVIRVLGQTRGANRALGDTQRRVRGLGRSSRTAAPAVRNLRTNLSGLSSTAGLAASSVFQLSGAFLAVGGLVLGFKAAIRASIEFESSMTRINTLVGVSANLTQQWADELLLLGPAVGRTPQELSEALFVVTSAGERTAEALKIVELAAKASAVGLGDTKTVARAVVSVMQAYQKTNLTAAEATDVLVATVREGNLEAAALAGSLGRVVGVAADAGVSFQEVGGFVATFTRVGVSAEEAVTALRATLQLIGKPSNDAREALAEFNITIQQVRESVGERGLARTLVDLVRILSEDDEALRRVFPNMRALAGILANASSQSEAFVEINKAIAESLGITEEAFAGVKRTGEFAFDSAKASASGFAIVIGDQVVPQLNEMLRVLEETTPRITITAFAIGALFSTVLTLVRLVTNSIEIVFNTFLQSMSAALGFLNQAVNRLLIGPINALVRVIPGLDFAIPRLPEFFELTQRFGAAAAKDLLDMKSAVESAAEAWARLQLAIEGVSTRLRDIPSPLRPGGGGGGAGGGGGGGLGGAGAAISTTFGAGAGARIQARIVADLAARFFKPFIDEANRLVEQSVPAAERYKRSLLSLQVAHNAEMITAEELARATEFLRQQYETSTRSFAELATTVGPAIASVIASVIRAARGGAGVFSAISGVLGAASGVVGLINPLAGAALLSGSIIAGALQGAGREQPVRVNSFGPRAMQQQRDFQRGPDTIIVQVISPSTGELLDEIVYRIDRRTRTDNFERLPRGTGAGTRERVGVPG